MEWNNFKSNSAEGDSFILGMMNTEKRWESVRALFTTFIEENGFTAWHKHNGWVRHGYKKGDVLQNEEINLVWIWEQAGFCHGSRCPEVGEKMVIVKDSPDGEKKGPFEMWCYDVISKRVRIGSPEMELRRFEIKQVIFNREAGRFEFVEKRKGGFLGWFRRK